MKKFNLKLTLGVITLLMLVTSCGTSKNTGTTAASNEVSIPFMETQYQSNDEYFRAKQVGESSNLSMAKKIALQNAKTEMAGNIESVVKAVIESYSNQRDIADMSEYESKMEEMSRNVINQKLTDVRIIGEKALQNNGKYSYWIVIESSKEAILNGLESGISSDQKLQLDYDKHLFEKTFNEEMKSFAESDNQ